MYPRIKSDQYQPTVTYMILQMTAPGTDGVRQQDSESEVQEDT